MERITEHYQPHLEWEVLEPNQEISHLTFEKGYFRINSDCIVRFERDNQYNLSAKIYGTTEDREALSHKKKGTPGQFMETDTVIGYSKDGLLQYRFFDVHLAANTLSPLSISPPILKFEADFNFSKVEQRYNFPSEEIVSIQEWYLTGHSNVAFPRSTQRSLEKAFKRLRLETDKEELKPTIYPSTGSSRDHLVVNYADNSFIVSEVPKLFGPSWAYNICIEYRLSFGRLPDENERKAISEIVSFVLGNQLLKIGQISLGENGSTISKEFENPWGDNVVSRCQRLAMPPVSINNYHDCRKVEKLLNSLVPHFLELRNKLNLSDSLWKYWMARYSPIGTNLPILSSAIETLADQVLKSHPEVKHFYIDYKEFCESIEEELSEIEKKLSAHPHKDKILSKVRGASQRGSNEKLKMMFEILDLPVGKIEYEAMKARNKMAHSSLGDVNDKEIMEIVRLTRAYETLFNRILLKLLSHDADYIDYYTLGYPNRNIREFIP